MPREAAFKAPGKAWGVMRMVPKGGELHPLDAQINRIIAMIRVKVDHTFRVIKRQFGHVKTRYHSLSNTAPSSSRCSRSATRSWCEEG